MLDNMVTFNLKISSMRNFCPITKNAFRGSQCFKIRVITRNAPTTFAVGAVSFPCFFACFIV